MIITLQRYLKEIKIQKIFLVTPGCSPLPSNETILKTAWKKILRQPERWFPLDRDGYVFIHIRMYSCWININNRLLLPCDQYACCWYSHWIQRTPDFRYIIDCVNQNPPCDFDRSSVNCDSPCSNLCSAAHIEDGELSRINSYDFDNRMEIKESVVHINPQPATNKLFIWQESEYKGEFEFIISDVFGNRIITVNGEKKSDELDINLELDKFRSGTYFYHLNYYKDMTKTKFGKIMITK